MKQICPVWASGLPLLKKTHLCECEYDTKCTLNMHLKSRLSSFLKSCITQTELENGQSSGKVKLKINVGV